MGYFKCHSRWNILDIENPQLIKAALEGLRNVLKSWDEDQDGSDNMYEIELEESGGIERIETLQSHANQNIYQLSVDILENFFMATDDDQEVVVWEKDKIENEISNCIKNETLILKNVQVTEDVMSEIIKILEGKGQNIKTLS